MDRRLREDQVTFLQKIKPFLLRNHHVPTPPVQEEKLVAAEDGIGVSSERLLEIIKRLEKLEKTVPSQEEDGFRTAKVKDKILSVLSERKRLTASQMSDILGLSRTRCSEYFRELMLEGRVEGVLVDRQKFYKLVKA
jgi:biotin operon repressor